MAEARWVDEQRLVIGGVHFSATAVALAAERDEFPIVKTPDLVRRYLSLLDEVRPRRIVELGVKEGGSTALLAMAAEPQVLLAVDLTEAVPPLLADLIRTADLSGSVHIVPGLDQGNRSALTETVDRHLLDQGIDLVIDDASHILGPTRTSFEVLFPRVRPGGCYVVEDWSSELISAAHLARAVPGLPDFHERLAVVNRIMHILNDPSQELPPDVVAAVTAAATREGETAADRTLFERLIEAVARADLPPLEEQAAPTPPLANLAVELLLIAATRPGLVADLRVDQDWLVVRRGDADIPLDSFRLADEWDDNFHYLS